MLFSRAIGEVLQETLRLKSVLLFKLISAIFYDEKISNSPK